MAHKPQAHLDRVTTLKVIQRFLVKVKVGPGDCWLWQGHVSRKGYGQFWMAGRAHWAHRVSFAIFCGEIPSGLTLDHTCSCTSCVNPTHLRLETVQENSRLRWRRKRQDCPSGQEGYSLAKGQVHADDQSP